MPQRKDGGLLPGNEDRRTLVGQGKGFAHKHSGIKGSKIFNLDIHSKQKLPQQHTYSNGQHDSPLLPSQNGGYKQSGASEIKQANLEPLDINGDHSYYRTSPRGSKHRSGLRVKECKGLQRVETRQSDISKTQPSIRDSRDRPFCLKGVETTKEILFLENRSIQSGQGCISGQLVPGFELCLSSIQSDRTSTKVQRERATLIFITPAWQTQSCLQKLMEMVISTPVLLPSYENLLSNPKRGDSPTLIKPILKAIGMESFRKKLSSEGISERASNLISNARRMGTNCNYE